MTFEQLNSFIHAAEDHTFLDAAEAVHMTQSALSKQIMKLEKELDLTLLDRSRRKAFLTPAGEAFYKEALVLTRQYQRMLSQMDAYRTAARREIRIGALPVLMQYGLTPRLKRFCLAYPDISLQLSEAEEPELLSSLNNHKFDFIIARAHLIKHSNCESFILAEDELTAVVPSSHPLAAAFRANQIPVPLTALADQDFILMHRYTSVYQVCLEQFQIQNIPARILRNARVESILSAVTVGEGISLMPRSNLDIFRHHNITALPLSPSVPLTLVLARKKGRAETDAAQAFLNSGFAKRRFHDL